LEEKATGTHRRSMLGGTQKGRTGKQGDAGQKRVSFDAIHEQWFSTQDGAYFHGHGIASSHELTQGKCMANLGPEAFRGYRRGDRLNGVQRSRGEVFGNTALVAHRPRARSERGDQTFRRITKTFQVADQVAQVFRSS